MLTWTSVLVSRVHLSPITPELKPKPSQMPEVLLFLPPWSKSLDISCQIIYSLSSVNFDSLLTLLLVLLHRSRSFEITLWHRDSTVNETHTSCISLANEYLRSDVTQLVSSEQKKSNCKKDTFNSPQHQTQHFLQTLNGTNRCPQDRETWAREWGCLRSTAVGIRGGAIKMSE